MSPKTQIPEEDFSFNTTSYVDPNGRLFSYQDKLYRGIYPPLQESFSKLIAGKSFRRLVKKGKLVATTEAEVRSESFDLILEHERLRYVTYCAEWPPEMLRDAGLLTLDICSELLKDDYILQDAHPWNVLFDGIKPRYVDVGSIRPLSEEHFLWTAYQQFCHFFLFPGYLYAKGLEEVARPQLFRFKDGVSYELCSRVIPLTTKLWNPQMLAHLEIPLKLSRMTKKRGRENKLREEQKSKPLDKGARKSFFASLRADLARLKFKIKESTWSNYYDSFPDFEDPTEWNEKQKRVGSLLEKLQPHTVIDVACNRGWYSLLAAHRGAKTLAFDFDASCVSQLYNEISKRDLDVQPLVIDLLNPTPAFGWRNLQYPSAIERFEADLVFAFAVIHHLVISQWQNFERVAQLLADFAPKALLVEFVPMSDDKSQEILAHSGRTDLDFYNLENFQAALSGVYESQEAFPSHPEGRVLILCQGRKF